MKRFLVGIYVFLIATIIFAVPAKRGVWKTLKLVDGSEVRATLSGDEAMSYYKSEQGECFLKTAEGLYEPVDFSLVTEKAKIRRAKFHPDNKIGRANSFGNAGNLYEGIKKGLIIIVDFADVKFKNNHTPDFFIRMANERGFTTDDGFNGSVKDYFRDQSNGKFEVDFDVVGPISMPKSYSYYGKNTLYDTDIHVGEMIADACKAVDDKVNFADYDWDGSGFVSQVFVIYSGFDEASGSDENTIWPHMWSLDSNDYGKVLMLDGVGVNVYACSSEMTYNYGPEDEIVESVNGIGTICHEYSHCLGFPDYYDTSGVTSNYGMGNWDLMDYGCYNNNGFTPAGYTAYEKWMAGWIHPVELTDDIDVRNLKAVSEGGDAYVIYNDNSLEEFYILENRNTVGWDSHLYNNGLLIQHVDYDELVWYQNTVNNDPAHQRCTIFHADNDDSSDYIEGLIGDIYPFETNDEISPYSTPKASLYKKNKNGNKVMEVAVSGITRNSDGTVSFDFRNIKYEPPVYQETFSACHGRGGNDGIWAMQGVSTFLPDLEGWTSSNSYGCNECARFGKSKVPAYVLSPEFDVVKDYTLGLLAGTWKGDGSVLTISFIDSNTGIKTSLGTYNLAEEKWTEITVSLEMTARGKFCFEATGRIFLDEIVVTSSVTSDIETTVTEQNIPADSRIYSIDGRYIGQELNSLVRGIYILNGKKFVKYD